MRRLEFKVVDWLSGGDGDPAAQATLASFAINAGADSVPVTEVDDTIAQTVRNHINVPLHTVSRWLLANWWRLRWEPHPTSMPNRSWLQAHSMASIGDGYAWPAIEFSSDGEFIQLHLDAEAMSDVSAIRYLRNVNIEIPAMDFEAAVTGLADQVDARLALCSPQERDFRELRIELDGERADTALANACRLQALAGINPGDATQEWLEAATKLSTQVGITAVDEVMAALPNLVDGLSTAQQVVDAMLGSSTTLDLSWVGKAPIGSAGVELPWERGARFAMALRQRLGLDQVL